MSQSSQPFELIHFSGADAAEFLQGQLTQDVRALDGAGALLAAWCNAKGRVACVARLLDPGDGIGLVVPSDLAQLLVKGFLLYRLRARVDIAVAADWRAAAVGAPADLAALESRDLLPTPERLATRHAHGLTAIALGGPEHCVELHGAAAAFEAAGLEPAAPLSDTDWLRALIEAGIPTITSETSGKYTPHMLNLDRLGAVSFTKGCYTGQEVVARTEHLGSVKRRLARFRLEAGEATTGDRLLHGGREVGEVVNAAAGHLLAVVPLGLRSSTLTIGGREASPVPLPYA